MAFYKVLQFPSEFVLLFKVCEQAVGQLQKQPDSLNSLELQYVLHGAEASRRKITITMQSFLASKAYSKLSNKVQPDSHGNIYLNSNDLNSASRDFVTNVVANEITDASYVDTGT